MSLIQWLFQRFSFQEIRNGNYFDNFSSCGYHDRPCYVGAVKVIENGGKTYTLCFDLSVFLTERIRSPRNVLFEPVEQLCVTTFEKSLNSACILRKPFFCRGSWSATICKVDIQLLLRCFLGHFFHFLVLSSPIFRI